VDNAQGYGIAKPLPLAALAEVRIVVAA